MALSIPKLAEQILLLYTGGRPTTEGIDVRIIEAWVEEALDNVVTEQFYNDYKAFGTHDVASHYKVPFIVGLSVDTDTNSKVALLPRQYVILPKDYGISSVSKGTGFSDELTFVKFNDWNALKSGGLLSFSDQFYYSPLNRKIYIRGNCPADKIPFSKVMLMLVVSGNETIDDGQALAITSKVLTLMDRQFRTSPDMVSDQNPKPTF
jgi:hypothetical protein